MTTVKPPQAPVVAVRFDGRSLRALDQTLLPWEERDLALDSAVAVAQAIKRLAIRGAPLIGVAAAYGVVVELQREPTEAALERACQVLRSARPTAVNLAYAVDRVYAAASSAAEEDLVAAALDEARALEAEELEASDRMAAAGAELLAESRRVLTHCNTGALAAPGRGTALAVIAELAARHGLETVLATESRPLLQGARLTVWELRRLELPHALIVDSAAAGLIAAGEVDAVVVGCDRVAANGDVANKVGTYGLALAAREAGIPFVVAGPTSTVDPRCPSGSEIRIEERDPGEVRLALSAEVTIAGTSCRNPAFDVTPARMITGLVTERGVARPVDGSTIREILTARR
ncbi:MAG TPA: S-methyl-5-thioribose-1-phosphate isomerase [Solirubrobacteraceae bacterium]|nr:S-methyl-5-thioribose-1-phosphate isomerase [Solirubrobacteraceae bacterium]